MENKRKFFDKDNIAHLSVIFIGAILFIGGCFQNSLWYDESYTVGLMCHSLLDSIKWAVYDVHPHLYYVMLKIFTMIFGNTLPAMRIFSSVGAILFVSLGYTHIKHDFGKKVGFWFSFCAVFSTMLLKYSLEIRMYTWAMYFVSLAAIYAFRSFNNTESKKDRFLFILFSILSAYTHYFGLFTVAVLNLITLYIITKEKIPLKTWLINAAWQIGCYIPGALIFLYQITLGGASWITIEWPGLIFDMVTYHMFGESLSNFMDKTSLKYFAICGVFFVFYVAGGLMLHKYVKSENINEKTKKGLKGALGVYYGTVLFTLTVSLFRVIFYIRYTAVLAGLLFFIMAVLLAGLKKNITKMTAALLLITMFVCQAVSVYKTMYHTSADYVKEGFGEKVEEDDVFLFEELLYHTITVQFPGNTAYYYDEWSDNFNMFRAFGENSYMINDLDCDEMKNLGDRVWVISKLECYDYLIENGYKETAEQEIWLEHHRYYLKLYLMEKQ